MGDCPHCFYTVFQWDLASPGLAKKLSPGTLSLHWHFAKKKTHLLNETLYINFRYIILLLQKNKQTEKQW